MSAKTTSFKGIIIYFLVALFLLYEMADQVTPSIIASTLMRDLHIHAAAFGWISGIYFYSYTAMQIPVGLLYDRYSYRRVLLVSLALCVMGCAIFAYSHGLFFIMLARFLLGIGSAFAFVGVLTVANDWFSARYFALLVGIAQALAAIGAASGELPLSLLVNQLGWRDTIKILAIVGLVLWALLFLFVKTYQKQSIARKHAQGQSVWQSLKEILTSRKIRAIAIYAFSAWTPIAIFASLWGIPFFMRRYGITNTQASFITFFIWMALAFISPILGILKQWIKIRYLLIICSAVGLLASLSLLYIPNLPITGSYVAAIGIGLAAGGQILTFDLVRSHAAEHDFATACGFNNMAVVIGGAILQPLVGILLDYFWNGHIQAGVPIYSVNNYQMALVLVPLSFALGLWISIRRL